MVTKEQLSPIDTDLIRFIGARIAKDPNKMDLGDIELLLRYTLVDMTKKDLYDIDKLNLKNIRDDIKGL